MASGISSRDDFCGSRTATNSSWSDHSECKKRAMHGTSGGGHRVSRPRSGADVAFE